MDRAGALVERYCYDEYGRLRLRESAGRGDMDHDTDMDSTDRTRVMSTMGLNPSIWDARADLDDDGDCDAADLTAYDTKDNNWPPQAYPTVAQALDMQLMECWACQGQAFSDFGNPFGFQGRVHFALDTLASATDGKLLLVDYRRRFSDPVTGRWLTRDPIGYLGGTFNFYEQVHSNPLRWWDPWGLDEDDPFKEIDDLGRTGQIYTGNGKAPRAGADEVRVKGAEAVIAAVNKVDEIAHPIDTTVNVVRGIQAEVDNIQNTGEGVGGLSREDAWATWFGIQFGMEAGATALTGWSLDAGEVHGWDRVESGIVAGTSLVFAVAGGLELLAITDKLLSGLTGKNPTFPPEAWAGNKCPKTTTPGTLIEERVLYNPKTGLWERSVAEYDQYGRQIRRRDYTDHGYARDHTDPHDHTHEWNKRYPDGKETYHPVKQGNCEPRK